MPTTPNPVEIQRSNLQQLVRHNASTLQNNEIAIYANTPYVMPNATHNIPLTLDLPANKEIASIVIGQELGDTMTYISINVLLQNNTAVNARGMESCIISIPAAIANGAHHFFLKVNGDKKKVISTDTSKHPEKKK